MTTVQSLLRRVQRLERARETPQSPFEVAFGSLGAFEDKVTADVAAGKLDRVDGPMMLNAVRKWHVDALWSGFRYYNNGRPQYANR